MTRRAPALAAVVALAGLAGGSARAGDFWKVPGADEASAYESAMRSGDANAERAAALSLRSTQRAIRYGKQAVRAYERAAEAAPERGEPHYRAAEVLYAHFIRDSDHPDRDTCQRALDHWKRFEELAPLDSRLLDILMRRALTHTKLADQGSLERALRDYDQLLGMIDSQSTNPASVATWISNKAEILMMLGRLDDAIVTYSRALEFEDRALYGYGLAVALDRDGQGVKAREVMRSFARSDRLRGLTESTVFFVPKGEIHYYFGLGHEVLGNVDKAIRHYERFVASGAHAQFSDRARDNIRALERRRNRGTDARDRAGIL